MLLSNLIYFEPIYCFMKKKVVFIFKNPLLLIIPKVYFHWALSWILFFTAEGRWGGPGRLLSCPVVGGSAPHHPSWGWHGTQLGSETWMLLVGGVNNITAQDSKFLHLIFHHGNSITLGLRLWL